MLAIDHFDYRMDDPQFRDLMLPVLEDLVYRRRYNVWIASSRDPVELLDVDPPVTDPIVGRNFSPGFALRRSTPLGLLSKEIPKRARTSQKPGKSSKEREKMRNPMHSPRVRMFFATNRPAGLASTSWRPSSLAG